MPSSSLSSTVLRLSGIAFFGAIGIFTRYFFSVAFEKFWNLGGFYATFSVNILGSFGIGILYVLAAEHRLISEDFRTMIAVGFFGGFTTFSSYTLDAIRLLQTGDWQTALAYFVSSPILGVFAAYVGMLLARLLPFVGVSM